MRHILAGSIHDGIVYELYIRDSRDKVLKIRLIAVDKRKRKAMYQRVELVCEKEHTINHRLRENITPEHLLFLISCIDEWLAFSFNRDCFLIK